VTASIKQKNTAPLTDAQQLANRLARVSRDMEEVIDYLDAQTELRKAQECMTLELVSAAIHACMSAAIVSYSRCFLKSKSKGLANPCVQPTQFAVLQEPWAEELHHHIVNMRNKAIAHADWEHHSTSLVERPGHLATVRISTIPNIYQNIRCEQFRELAQTIANESLRKRFQLDLKI